MVWVRNKLEKDTEIEVIPGSPAIPGSEGSAGSPAYTYWKETVVPGGTYVGGPPTGYDVEVTIPLPGGGYQTLRSGGYRYFNGEKAYLQTVIGGVDYVYKAPSQTIREQVYVPAVPPVPPTPPVPEVPSQISEDYNLGWNAGAYGPATLAENKVFTWKFSAGNVGSVVGLTLATAPQDYSYTSMAFSVMAQSGRYWLYRGAQVLGSSTAFKNNDKFALKRTNQGTVELYVSGGLVHTEALADDVVPDCSLYSGGDVIWDAEVIDAAVAPLNSEIAAVTASDAQADATKISVTRTFGPNTALGVAGASTLSAAVAGAVAVNGSVYTSAGALTVSDAVALDDELGVQQTFGPGTAKGLVGSSTVSDAVATGDATTGVGISTNTSTSSSMNMLPMTGAGSGPNVADGWTGNYVGDSLNMLPMTIDASGDLAAPTVGVAKLIMAPMDCSATGLTGETSVSSNCQMLPMAMFGSSETTYSQAYCSMAPMQGGGTDEPYDDLVDQAIEIVENILATDTVQAVYSIRIQELLQTSTPTQTFYQLAEDLLEALRALDSTQTSLIVTVSEALSITDTGGLSVTQVMKVIDRLLATGSVQTVYSAAAIVLSAATLLDSTISAESTTLTDSATAADTLVEIILALALITDSMNVTDTVQVLLTIAVVIQEDASTADTIELDAQYFNELLDTVEVLAFIKTPAELAQGWVMNTEGAQPISEYDNYTFNSMAYSPDEMLGCNDQGLYVLDGDDDAGTDIDAHITSLMLDFETTKLKRMSTAYIGYTSTGQLLLKVRSEEQGTYAERWYEARESTAQTAPSQNRMKIGKGLRSRYWTFELTNVDGSDFELDKVELYPIVLERRV